MLSSSQMEWLERSDAMEGNAIDEDSNDRFFTTGADNTQPHALRMQRPGQTKNLRQQQQQQQYHNPFNNSDEHPSHTTTEDSDRPTVELLVNRDVHPPFLSSTNVTLLNKQTDIIVPVTSPTAELVLAAEKGSEGLFQFRKEMAAAEASRQAMDTTQSDLAKILRKHPRSGVDDPQRPGEATEDEETEALKRKIRLLEQRQGEGIKPLASSVLSTSSSSSAKSFATTAAPSAIVAVPRSRPRTDEEDEAWAALQQSRRQLPIFQCKDELMRYIGENTVSIIMGETGSGKTTQLVQYLYEQGYARGDQMIGCTQPRRIAAIGVATRVAEEVGCELGTTVGYAIHLDDRTSASTKVRFMTDGVLLRELVHDRDVQKYSVIILDEAHERSVDTDVLLGVLKDVCRRRLDLKVIVTSATMDLVKFSRFFDNAPFYEISGVTYDVDVRYSTAPVRDYVTEAVFKAIAIHVQNPIALNSSSDTNNATDGGGNGGGGGGDILIFMTGRDDVYGTCEMIEKTLRDKFPAYAESLLVVPCMSEASGMQATVGSVLGPAPPGKRKCVVSTNVAETSLTIHGIRYVIDCGFMKANVFRPRVGMNTLRRYPTSQAQANQRKGRAGRTAAGICFRLYTREQFEEQMLVASVPEIQRSSIDSVVLLLKSIGVRDLSMFDFIDPPPEANVRNALWRLWLLHALWDTGDITPLGRQMLEFPTGPHLAKLLVDSSAMNCALEALHVVAMISSDPKGLFEVPKGREEKAMSQHSRFYHHESDHLTLHQVLHHYLANGRSRSWAQDHFLNVGVLERAVAVLEQLTERMQRCKLPYLPSSSQARNQLHRHRPTTRDFHHDAAGGDDDDASQIRLTSLRECIAKALVIQSAQRHAGKWTEYVSLLNAGVVCHVHPNSAINAAGSVPEYIVYGDLLFTTKEYAMTITAVEPEWLVAAGKGLFQVKGQAKQEHEEDEDALLPLPSLLMTTTTGSATTGASADTMRRAGGVAFSSGSSSASGPSQRPAGGTQATTKKPVVSVFAAKKRANV